MTPSWGGGTPDTIETTLQHNPESHDERIMSTQPTAPPIAPRRGGAEPPAQPTAPPIAPRRGGAEPPAEPPAEPLHATNRTPSWGGGTPGAPPPLLACTRFNNKTWQEYQTWLSAYQQSYEQIYQRPLKCIYGAPREISHKKIPPQAKILVIEMNNDENKIMGIGEIMNETASEPYKPAVGGRIPPFHKIFSDRNYTRYIYIGNTRYASREELERNHTPDAQYINEQLKSVMPQTPPLSNSTEGQYLQKNHPDPHPHPDPNPDPPSWGGGTPLERLLFKGARHMKRGSGITRCSFMK
jgi:hypothetical protein